MTEEQISEARRWVALPGWRWMPGMCSANGSRVLFVDDDNGDVCLSVDDGQVPYWLDGPAQNMLPDVTDPATRGCLLALAREITGQPDLSTVWISSADVWCPRWMQDGRSTFGAARSRETAALLEAVEDYYRARG
jgi:hypothetical protein